jgi:hypothetical protein
MSVPRGIQCDTELENTRKKLHRLEELVESKKNSDDELQRAERISLKRLINQLKEEIARYEAHQPGAVAEIFQAGMRLRKTDNRLRNRATCLPGSRAMTARRWGNANLLRGFFRRWRLKAERRVRVENAENL